MLETIKTTVLILTPLSDATSLADSLGPVRHWQKALMTCPTSLTFFSDIIPTCNGHT